MKRWTIICLALGLSGCSAHALRQMLTPESEPLASVSRLQFECTANGLFIFEDFPDIVRAHPLTISPTPSTDGLSGAKRSNADISDGCFSSMR